MTPNALDSLLVAVVAVLVPLCAADCNAQANPSIALRSDLVIGDVTGAAFGGGLHLAVDANRRIYVGDSMNRNVSVFAPTGVLLETVGRSGRGPGEFTAIHSIAVTRGDSLYVFDANAGRLSVFAPGDDPSLAYTVTPARPPGLGHPYMVLVPVSEPSGFLFVFRQQGAGTLSVHRVEATGEVETRPVFDDRSSPAAVDVRSASGGVAVVRTSPLFAPEGLVGITPNDEIFYVWSAAIDLEFYDLQGRWLSVFKAYVETVPVSERDIEFELAGSSQMRRQAVREMGYPGSKPALHTAIVDDRSWIWTGRYTNDPRVSEWWVTPGHGRGKSAIFTLPSNVDIQVVQDGYAYAVSEDAIGAPTVVRYVIETEGTMDLRR